MESGEGRAGRKKREARARIISAAAGLVIEKGARAVSMDEVAEKAGVARRTLFNYFEGKEELLFAVTSPMLEEAVALVDARLAGAPSGLGSITGLCLDLWKSWGRRLGLLYSFELTDSGRMAELHGIFLSRFQRLVADAIAAEPALASRPRLVGRIVYRSFVPLLTALEGAEDGDAGVLAIRFKAGMRGLLEGIAKTGT